MNVSPIMIRALIELEDFHDFTEDQAGYDAIMSMTLAEIRRLADIQLSAEYALRLLNDVTNNNDPALLAELDADIEKMMAALGGQTVQ